ncbi:MAG TPA: HupE/UreJ family protein [Vicinamibacterales bacterium]|nr:HupE/UreJ family protein [Vicinamibacterales bacterium]
MSGIGARRTAMIAGAAIGIALIPGRVEAHLVTTGLGPIYDGVTHVVSTPDDLIPTVMLALLAGLNGAAAGRRALFALTAAWLAGGGAGFVCGQPIVPSAAPVMSLLALGALTAADRRLSSLVVTGIAVTAGLVHGALNGAAVAAAGREAIGLIGMGSTVFVVTAIAAACAASLRAAWPRLVVRVFGSWVAAIGLLMLGWELRPVG